MFNPITLGSLKYCLNFLSETTAWKTKLLFVLEQNYLTQKISSNWEYINWAKQLVNISFGSFLRFWFLGAAVKLKRVTLTHCSGVKWYWWHLSFSIAICTCTCINLLTKFLDYCKIKCFLFYKLDQCFLSVDKSFTAK